MAEQTDKGGACLGTMLWCAGHVYVLRGSDSELGNGVRRDTPPWEQTVVRGKKGRGKASAKTLAALAKATAAATAARRSLAQSAGKDVASEGAGAGGGGSDCSCSRLCG